MRRRLSRQTAATLIIYFMMITSVFGPAAFFSGKARGETRALASADASPFEAPETAGDGEFGRPSRPGGEHAGATFNLGQPRTHRTGSENSPFRQASIRALAEDAASQGPGGGPILPGDPLSLAMAPELAGVTGGGRGGGADGGPHGILIPSLSGAGAPPPSGPPKPPGGGNPPDGEPPDGETPDGETPVLVTPLPPALPLLIVGMIGLFTAARRPAR